MNIELGYCSINEGLGGDAVLYAAKASLDDALLGARVTGLVYLPSL